MEIASTIHTTQTSGYAVDGDEGPARYRRKASEPAHAAKFQDSEGGWWEIIPERLNVRQFGAKGDNSTDDTAAIQACIDAGFVLNLGEVWMKRGAYRTTGPVYLDRRTICMSTWSNRRAPISL